MLNEPEESSQFTEELDLKDPNTSDAVAHHKSDTDSDKESSKPCRRRQPRVGSGTASHRAKVTVQRRANTNQKVVSLSVGKARELGTAKLAAVPAVPALSMDRLASPNTEECQDEEAEAQQEKDIASNMRRQSESDRAKTGVTFPDILEVDDDPKNTEHSESSTCDKLKSLCADEEDKVVAFSTKEKEVRLLDPPPIRLRQAWASPTTYRHQEKTSSQGTNTVSGRERRRKKTGSHAVQDVADGTLAQRPADSAASEEIKGEPDTTGDSEEPSCSTSSGSEAKELKKYDLPREDDEDPKAEELTKDIQKESNQSKTVVDIKLPTAAKLNKRLTKTSRSSSNKVLDETTKITGNTPPNLEGETSKSSEQAVELKNQGMGDGENVHRHEESKHNKPISETPVASSSAEDVIPEREAEITTTKENKKTKKLFKSSLFSWPMFKKKPGPKVKQKKIDATPTSPPEKASDPEGSEHVAKSSMADILYNQGRVAMPQSLTKMFAASKPGTATMKGGDQAQASDQHLAAEKPSQ